MAAVSLEDNADVGIVCRLAHDHVGDDRPTQNDVLRKLPRDFRGKAVAFEASIVTNLDITPSFKSRESALASIYHKLAAYQLKKEHHRPPSRLERLQGSDSFHAKRISCELVKAWVLAHRDSDDESLDEEEVNAYKTFVVHLLYYFDRWAGKYFSTDGFCEVFVAVHAKLNELSCACASSDRHYHRALEKLQDKSSELCGQCVKVALLAVTDNHAELEALCQKRGPLSMRLISSRRLRTNSTFWCTDYGQVLDAALVRGDPETFAPGVSGTSSSNSAAEGHHGGSSFCNSWSLFTHEANVYRKYEFTSSAEAEYQFEACHDCAVLVGPAGKLREKAWGASRFKIVNEIVNVEQTMRSLNQRADQFLMLQRAALGLPTFPQPSQEGYSSSSTCPGFGQSDDPVPLGLQKLSEMGRNLDGLRQAQGWLAKASSIIGAAAQEARALAPQKSRRRPELGDTVRILVENEVGALESPERNGTRGRLGTIVEDDFSDQPYNIDLGDGTERWYKEEWVFLIEEAPAGGGDGPSSAAPPAVAAAAAAGGGGLVLGPRTSQASIGEPFAPPSVPAAAQGGAVAAAPGPASAVGSRRSPAEELPKGQVEKVVVDAQAQSCTSSDAASSRDGDVGGGSPAGKAKALSPLDGAESAAAAAGFEGGPPEKVPPGAAAGDADGQATSRSSEEIWEAAITAIFDRWVEGADDVTGLAEAFRGGQTIKWQETIGELRYRNELLPTLILDIPRRLAELLRCHASIMGSVNGMISRGGSKEALAAIYALRARSSITGSFAKAVDSFVAAASIVNCVAQQMLFRHLEDGLRLQGQVPSMQRQYLEAFSSCAKLRDHILTEWHQLSIRVSDERLASEFERINSSEREAYMRLMTLPAMTPALGNAPFSAQGGAVGPPLSLHDRGSAGDDARAVEETTGARPSGSISASDSDGI